MDLHNKLDRKALREKLEAETFSRITLSFYRYVIIDNTEEERNKIFAAFNELGVLGRIYIAYEGINAQISVPECNFEKLRAWLDADVKYKNVPFKIAIEDDGKSFIKLIVKIRKKIVADGLNDGTFDVTNVGTHLSAEEFNTAMEQPGTLVVDMRNHYESEVGHFENSILPDADTFRQALPKVVDILSEKKENKILLFCTGGIRCEKASAYLKHHGFKDVNQLHGGIISYAHEIKEKGLKNKFLGKNFVFDSRMGERIGDEIISHCHQCGAACDRHVNCNNDDCHLLFIQCESCAQKMDGCCTAKCKEIYHLPLEEQIKLRKGQQKVNPHQVFKSRLRPKLMQSSED